MDSVKRKVEVGVVILFSHRWNITVNRLKSNWLKGLLQIFKDIEKYFIFQQIARPEETNVQGLRFIEIVVVVIEHIHLFKLIRDNDFLFQH